MNIPLKGLPEGMSVSDWLLPEAAKNKEELISEYGEETFKKVRSILAQISEGVEPKDLT